MSVPPPPSEDPQPKPVPVPPAAPKQPPRVAPTAIGGVLAGGGVLAVIAGFLRYEKQTWSRGSYSLTGLGSETATGQAATSIVIEPGSAGKFVFGVGIVAVVLGLLAVLRQGRLWVGIVAVVAGAIGVIIGVAAIRAASTDADRLQSVVGEDVTGSVGVGAIIGTVGAAVALLGGILAIVKRTPKPTPDTAPELPTGPEPGDELAS